MTRPVTRIGLYGGSFDPPHLAHVLAATWALCRADIDELRLVPAYQHAFGKTLSPFDVRCAMLEAATRHLGPTCVVDRVEERLGGTSYTVNTVEALLAERPDAAVVWIGGADSWASRAKWHRWSELEALITPFILGREGEPAPEGVDASVTLPAVSSTAVRAAVPDRPLLIGSGADEATVASLLEVADGVIVGTSIKTGGQTTAPVDADRARRFVVAARGS